MTKAELIERIARNRDLPPDVTKKVIAQILDLAFAELASYFVRTRVTRSSTPRFTFPKFGTWTKKTRSGRRGVNPRTLEPIVIEACETVDFKPSAELKRLLNESSPKKSVKKSSTPKARAKKKARKGPAASKATSPTATTPTKAKRATGGEGRAAKKASKISAKKTGKSGKSGKGSSKASASSKAASASKGRPSGPGGRRLVSREEVELETTLAAPLLPDAPLQRVASSVRRGAKKRSKDVENTGS